MIKRFAVPVLVLLALAGLAIWGAMQQAAPEDIQPIPCTHPVSGCTFMHRNAPAQIRFSVAPEPLKPFVVTISHPTLSKASVSFQMAGMDMGFNRYDFRKNQQGVWSASITLPVCVSGRVDWISEFQLDDRFYSLAFVTDH